jgi:hypothetical protein
MDTPDHGFGLAEDVARTLLGTRIDGLEQVGGGRNSRVFHVRSARGQYALKQYPSPQEDPRDRLGTEIDTLAVMAQQGFDCVPRVVAADRQRGFAVLSWIDGTPVGTISDGDIDQACEFLARVHALRKLPALAPGRLASEACLSGAEIERQIAGRMSELAAVASEERKLHAFLDHSFRPAGERLVARGKQRMRAASLDFAALLPEERRSLVPSDFGFHNAIRRPDGSLAFIDFEYFGWDDPVKLTSDVLFHPGIPLADDQRRRFRSQAQDIFGDDTHFESRLEAYLPLFGLRWVLIVLNEFLPRRWRLRQLAGATDSWGEAKQRQLKLAQNLLLQAEAA